jgi:hypothetical protein
MEKAINYKVASIKKLFQKSNRSENELLVFRHEKLKDTSIKMSESNELHFVEKR